MSSPSSEARSLSVSTAVSSPAAGTPSVSPTANTTSLPVLAQAVRSPAKTASCLGGISESSAAANPLLNMPAKSRTARRVPAVSFSASSKTAHTASYALPQNAASAG